MLGTANDVETVQLHLGQTVLRQHALDSRLDDALGVGLEQLGVAIATQATRTTGCMYSSLPNLLPVRAILSALRMITWLPESACGA